MMARYQVRTARPTSLSWAAGEGRLAACRVNRLRALPARKSRPPLPSHPPKPSSAAPFRAAQGGLPTDPRIERLLDRGRIEAQAFGGQQFAFRGLPLAVLGRHQPEAKVRIRVTGVQLDQPGAGKANGLHILVQPPSRKEGMDDFGSIWQARRCGPRVHQRFGRRVSRPV